jgi:uncharacterized repeat protein (TIGR03803 family)
MKHGNRNPGLAGAMIAASSMVLVAPTAASAQTLTTLHAFERSDGVNPQAGLLQASDGNFYGTTLYGTGFRTGTIFRMTPVGNLTTLYAFCTLSICPDGKFPNAGLIHGSDGNFYGTAMEGGQHGFGTIFKITPGGSLTTVHSFEGRDGNRPSAALFQGSDGNFYGTTYLGGTYGWGTIFKMTPAGVLTTLHSFHLFDGAEPFAALIQASDGNFYGTTQTGGPIYGSVFKMTPRGTLTTLHSFCLRSGCEDGQSPLAALVQASDGNFYGTTFAGGAFGWGTVFRIAPDGTFTTLHSFGQTDGAFPAAALIQATDGNLYGTTENGGTRAVGTIFRITLSGVLTTLSDFYGVGNGTMPSAPLIQAADESFYGTTTAGGDSTYCTGGCGTVFRLSGGLEPW